MSTIPVMPQGDQWKDPFYVSTWKAARKKQLDEKWGAQVNPTPLFTGIANSVDRRDPGWQEAREITQWEDEALTHRAKRLDGAVKLRKHNRGGVHQVPAMLAKLDNGFILTPIGARAKKSKLEKAKVMYDSGLDKKAQRELACGLLGGEVTCKSGHAFVTAYECGNRYCETCGPKGATQLFARQVDKLLFVAQRLMLCSQDECGECSQAIEGKRVPHWPPPKNHRPKIVCAKLDFTLRHTGGTPAPERMRELNRLIKKFMRAAERRFGFTRKDYGLAYCDELGGNNSNPHAHGIYVGPWLPQEKKQLSSLWQEVTGDSFIISIKYAKNFTEALFHAIKYPAKFAERSTPSRLAFLETVFHRVRRFHTLAAFYAPEAPKPEKPPVKSCPICQSPLSEPKGLQSLAELYARGLKSMEVVAQDLARSRGLSGPSPPP